MQMVVRNDIALHARVDGPGDGRPVMFANSLGTDLRVWEPILPHLPSTWRIIRFDNRGHGLSDCPPPPYDMAELVADAAAVADALSVRDCAFVGLSIGGLIGQGLASARPDIIERLVLMDTAAKIGTQAMWAERVAAIEAQGMAAMTDTVMQRWFAAALLEDTAGLAPWRNMFARTPLEGYIGCCAAIAGSDFTESSPKLTIPVMAMAGSEDKSTPPHLVKETADMCNGTFHEIANAGHLPGVEKPREVAKMLVDFVDGSNDD